MKKLIVIFAIVTCFFTGCEELDVAPLSGDEASTKGGRKNPADVAIQWINLQQELIKTTAGFDPMVASRSFAYSGIAMYESLVKGMPGYQSVASPRIGTDINAFPKNQSIHWPSSVNAAMAFILKKLFGNTSEVNQVTIDSLESAFNFQFQNQTSPQLISESANYGRKIANSIFEWSKTDGGHEAYLSAISDTYVAPTGAGLWIPTPPAFSKPIRPYWGDNRSFVPNSALATMPPPPVAYSEDPESDFHQMVDEVYSISLSLTEDDVSIVKHWADLPGNYGTPGHYTHIVTQLLVEKNASLEEATIAYAKHGIAINEALIGVLKAKYTYNLIRPVSYIRNVLGYSTWSTVIGTPAHPEYPSAHAVIGGASYTILESIFGKNYSFVDRTHENLYGAKSYSNLREYATEAAWSRVLGGIHYNLSAEVGLTQGEKIGKLVNAIQFRGN